ncbi:MAG: hypothetical protein ACU836_16325 [Gammaproteobacteria bacterium]
MFIRLAFNLTRGKYLGAYNGWPLVKGPGYPVFLALNHFIGLPITVSQGIFFLLAIGFFCFVAGKIFDSPILAYTCFIVLTLHPSFLVGRIIREAIYTPQVFLFLALILAAFWQYPKHSISLGVLGGIAFSWYWLTREEGMWVIPGMAVLGMVFFSLLRKRNEYRGTSLAGLAAWLFVSATGIMAYPMANWLAYGSFQGTDVKESNFVAAVGSLQRVRDGKTIPHVPVSSSTRQIIYSVSPTFARLRGDLDPKGGRDPGPGCRYYPQTCGDITGGWFIWEFRKAVGKQGVLATPSQAKAFFKKIATEVSAACDDGRLHCSSSLVSLMPYVSHEQISNFPGTLWEATSFLFNTRLHRSVPRSTGSIEERQEALRFLNYPIIAPTPGEAKKVHISGWYTQTTPRPFRITVLNSSGEPSVQETIHADAVANAYGRERSTLHPRHRFTVVAECDTNCSAIVDGLSAASSIHMPVRSLLSRGKTVQQQDSRLFMKAEVKRYVPTIAQNAASAVASFLTSLYGVGLVILLPVGLLSLLASTYFARNNGPELQLVGIAWALWVLVLCRVGLIALIDISAFPAINAHYLSPALYLAPCAAVLSLACLERSLRNRRPIKRHDRSPSMILV